MIDHLLAVPEPVALFAAYVEPTMEFMEMVDERGVAIPHRIGIEVQTEDALNGTMTKAPSPTWLPTTNGRAMRPPPCS